MSNFTKHISKFVGYTRKDRLCPIEEMAIVIEKVRAYAEKNEYKHVAIREICDCTKSDPENQRYYVEIQRDEFGYTVVQWLVILNGVVMNGDEYYEHCSKYELRKTA